jgi:hypothetical protein
MSLIVRLLAKYALWIYLLCGVTMLFYLRAALAARREGTQAIYSLERESASGRIYRASGMIFLLLLIVVGVYALSHYAEVPSPVTSPVATPVPTVTPVLPAVPSGSPTSSEPTLTPEPTNTRRPRTTAVVLPTNARETPTVQVVPAACSKPNVQVFQPGQNQVVDAQIEVRGIATKEGFDRYEFKFRSRDVQDEWHWVETFKTPVENGTLGVWQTSHLPAGNYSFMLIVIDRTGNSEECVVPVVVAH